MGSAQATELRAKCAQMNVAVTEQQVERLLQFADELLRWNKVYNLTAINSPAQVMSHHLLDCLAVVPHLPAVELEILDVGAGGGLPGVVLSIMNPRWRVTCVDAVAKKMAFVQQLAGSLGLPNLKGVHTRLNLQHPAKGLVVEGYDVVTCRAFSSLVDFVTLTKFHVKHQPGAAWLAMKGMVPHKELADLKQQASNLAMVCDTVALEVPGLNKARCLVRLQPVW